METSGLLDHQSISSDNDYIETKWLGNQSSIDAVASYRKKYRSWILIIIAFIVGLLSGLMVSILSSTVLDWQSPIRPNSPCISTISRPSPLLEDVEITYHEQMFNGSLLEETIYRLDASPEVDEAWNALGASPRPMLLSPKRALAAGVPSDWVHTTSEYGSGYLTYVEGLHHLHCLNLLRQSLYFNVNYYRNLGRDDFGAGGKMLRLHVTHCLDILRQQLMCTVDIGIFGMRWAHMDGEDERDVKGYPDFNTKHVCRNFEDIRDWALSRQTDENALETDGFLQPPVAGDRIYEGIP